MRLGGAPPETVLPGPPPGAREALGAAVQVGSLLALSEVAARWPRLPDVWASLAEVSALVAGERGSAATEATVMAYAFARTGYHRGLDMLRAAGWRGSGYVRWQHPSNRGFLRCLDALRRLAGEIGESDEEQRCAVFLRQLDPDWDRRAV